jgi:hypothetical protein
MTNRLWAGGELVVIARLVTEVETHPAVAVSANSKAEELSVRREIVMFASYESCEDSMGGRVSQIGKKRS